MINNQHSYALNDLEISMSQLEPDQFPKFEKQALKMMMSSNYIKAEMIYRLLIQYSYINESILNNLAIIYGKKGMIDNKIKFLNASLEVNSSFVDAHFNLANTYSNLCQYDKAIFEYDRTILLDENHYKALNNLGNVYFFTKNFIEAKKCLYLALDVNSDYALSHNNLGNIFKEEGDFTQAIQSYKQAIKINKFYIDAINNLASCLFCLGFYEESFEVSRKSVNTTPWSLQSSNLLGQSMNALNKKIKHPFCN